MKLPRLQTLRSVSAVLMLGTALLSSCATTPDAVPYTGIEAPFIPDAKPLGNPNSTNLRDFASTLPIYHSGDSRTWVRSNSPEEGEWLTRVGDPNTPVRIKRLPAGPGGAQRIRVLVGPSRESTGPAGQVWVYELERTKGGWNQLVTP